MATEAELLHGLQEAHKAGNAAHAQAFADALRAVRSASGAPVAAPVGGSPPVGAPAAPEGLLTKSSGAWDKFKHGLANSGIETYLGGKQLFKDLDPEEMSVLKQSRSDVKEGGGWGTTGQVTGGVAQAVAGTVMAPAKLAKVLSFLKGAAPVANAAVSSGLQSAAFTPIEDQENKWSEKAKEGAKAAAVGGTLTAATRGLTKAVTGAFKPTAEAEALMAQGVNPTLQQGADGKIARFVGGLTSGSTHVRNRQEQELLDALTDRATKGQVSAKGSTLAERLAMINHSIDNDYDGILSGKTFPMNNKIRDGVMAEASALEKSGGRNANEAVDAGGLLRNIIGTDRNSTRLKGDTLRKDFLDRIQNEISDSNHPLVNEALVNAKNLVMKNSRDAKLTPDELTKLKDIDSRYFDLMRLKDVAKGGAQNDTGVPIKKIADAYGNGPGMDMIGATNATNEALVGPAFRTLGKMPRQDEARGLLIAAKRAAALGGVGAAAGATGTLPVVAGALAPVYATSLLGQTAGGARFLFGHNDWQKNLKAGLESPQTKEMSMANLLRALRDNSAGVGAGLTVGE